MLTFKSMLPYYSLAVIGISIASAFVVGTLWTITALLFVKCFKIRYYSYSALSLVKLKFVIFTLVVAVKTYSVNPEMVHSGQYWSIEILIVD